MILVTGGAGFIGSHIVAELEEAGIEDVVVCDRLRQGSKWLNLRKHVFSDFVPPEDLTAWLAGRKELRAVIHMGAISSTTATDGDEVMASNFRLSVQLLDWCTQTRTPFIYASSAATYGLGETGFDDDNAPGAVQALRPLNLYGWSKRQFDAVVATRAGRRDKLPPSWAGFRFFNVYGPNEYHKGEMQSIVAKLFARVKSGSEVGLFKSHRPDVADGKQQRDFVYVRDVAAVLRWFLEQAPPDGIYNLGTGQPRSFRALVEAMYAALGTAPRIGFIDMPPALRDKYQYFTAASLSRLRQAGYASPFTSIEDGVRDYVCRYLDTDDPYR
jgi:ADP-L-glycero-D-manno-heptose 6-epimerase